MNWFFCSSDLTETYYQIMSRFIESLVNILIFIWAELLVVRIMSWEFMSLNKQTELLYWKSSLIYWHIIINFFSLFDNVLSISCLWILSEIFYYNAATLTNSFQSSSSIRFKNSKKKLVNFWFLYWRFSSFVIAVCLWLMSS